MNRLLNENPLGVVHSDHPIRTTDIHEELDDLVAEIHRMSRRYDLHSNEIVMRLMDRLRGVRS
jgi:hypothetical protein